MMFAMCAVMIVSGVGAGIDLMRAYASQQKLSEVAALACQYASRPSVIQTTAAINDGGSGVTSYVANVTGYLNATLQSQGFQYTQSTSTPFTAVKNGAANVALSSSVPTIFMRMVNINAVPVAASTHCYDTPSGISQVVANGARPNLVTEGFESNPCGATVCYTGPNGVSLGFPASLSSPSSNFPGSPNYTGAAGAKWYTMGYCLETDKVGVINANVPEGSYAAELDCDNGSGSAGNSSISTQVYLAPGNYELRWFFRSRVTYPDYMPTYICGSQAADTSWANDSNTPYFSQPFQVRSNQINVYLDQPTSSGVPPLHTTIFGNQQLGGSNLIDHCVDSLNWVERSVRIKVTTASYYWLTFAADGADDSYGGQIDNIRLCQGTCAGAVQDNFPATWLASGNGGVNKVLFEDTFDSPGYTDNTGVSANTNGNLNASLGNSGNANSGWPYLAAAGWATAPQNEIIYNTAYAAQGSQNLWLSTPNAGRNRLIGRSFLLVPGFYNLAYSYVSEATFPALTTTYCGATPALANMSALSGNGSGVGRNTSLALSGALNTNTVAAFIASGQLTSTPIGGGALNSTTSYTNPNGTTSTTPTVAPDAISLTNYVPSTTSALLDLCGYAANWTARSVNFEIVKTGYYWLYFSTQMAGTSSYGGAAIDDVRLTALGSPAMLSPPFNPVVVPAAGTPPSTTLAFTGFSIVSAPLVAPAPAQ